MILKCQLIWENFNFQEVKVVGFKFIHHRQVWDSASVYRRETCLYIRRVNKPFLV